LAQALDMVSNVIQIWVDEAVLFPIATMT
jgi:hypothetical protein